ncbi:dihydrofolate reductase family protein [uncultured Brevibacterium sp.]|uniref:dihydrofolate reductase family protein n=1 Tax=uncultured Brevibacterium sp. TaxID=189678 RepID=UPI0025D58483|nr:dihydrofolate reductase family protein [uncultured Brevibacterium sp.]
MRKVIVLNNVSLDGVMQAPGRPNEDERNGFDRGGWAQEYNDDVKSAAMGVGMASGAEFLLGRRTYEDLYSAWHGQTGNPFTQVLDNTPKYVASSSAQKPLIWENSTLLTGDVIEAVEELKKQDGPDLLIMGSNKLVESLRAKPGVIDEYQLMIHPLVLGKGLRQFPDGAVSEDLELVGVPTITTTGVIIATYRAKS